MNNHKLIIACLFFLASTSSFAAWDRNCLNTCFSTNHECKYCDFKCRVEEQDPVIYETNDPTCPLANYPGATN